MLGNESNDWHSRTLAVTDNGRKCIDFIDLISHETTGRLDLGEGDWSGLSIFRSADSSIHLAVSDLRSNTVKIFDMVSKKLIRSIGAVGRGSEAGKLHNPNFLCVHQFPGDGEPSIILVSNKSKKCIDIFEFESGLHLRSIRENEHLESAGGAVAVWVPRDNSANAQIVVADRNRHCISFFSLIDGKYLRSIGGETDGGPGLSHWPRAMAIHLPIGGDDGGDEEDALLVTLGSLDNRIHVYSLPTGTYLRSIGGGQGQGTDQISGNSVGIAFYQPAGEAASATQVIISDRVNLRLQIFNLYSGEHICSVGGRGMERFKNLMCIEMINSEARYMSDWDFLLK